MLLFLGTVGVFCFVVWTSDKTREQDMKEFPSDYSTRRPSTTTTSLLRRRLQWKFEFKMSFFLGLIHA